MAGDDKLVLQVGGVTRATPVRRTASGSIASANPHTTAQPAPTAVPVARLISLANEMAAQEPPVDYARIASLRAAIASGEYSVDPVAIAKSMALFHSTGGNS